MAKPKGLVMPLLIYAHKYPQLLSKQDTIEGIRLNYPDVDWIDSDLSHLKDAQDKIELADFYLKLVREHHVEVLLGSTSDINALICAYLTHHCPWIKSNTVESALMCNSKYLTRSTIVPDEYNLKHHLITLDSEEDISEAIKVVGFPMILKPTCGSCSVMVKKCVNEEEVRKYLEDYKEEERLGNISSYYDIFGKLLIGLEDKYPHLKGSNVLAEECVLEDEAPSCTIEYIIQDGKMIEVAIVDNVYWPSNPRSFVGCCFPTSYHTEAALKAGRDMAKQVTDRLIHYGFNNCIGNLEYFIFKDGTVKLMEINSRMFLQVNECTRTLLHNGDKLRIVIDLQKGVPITPPKYKFLDDDSAPKFVFNFYINSMESGLAGDMFNYAYAEELERDGLPGLTRCQVIIPPEKQVVCTSDSGVNFAWCFMYGDSYIDCLKKFKPLFYKLLLNSEKGSLWEDRIMGGIGHPAA